MGEGGNLEGDNTNLIALGFHPGQAMSQTSWRLKIKDETCLTLLLGVGPGLGGSGGQEKSKWPRSAEANAAFLLPGQVHDLREERRGAE